MSAASLLLIRGKWQEAKGEKRYREEKGGEKTRRKGNREEEEERGDEVRRWFNLIILIHLTIIFHIDFPEQVYSYAGRIVLWTFILKDALLVWVIFD